MVSGRRRRVLTIVRRRGHINRGRVWQGRALLAVRHPTSRPPQARLGSADRRTHDPRPPRCDPRERAFSLRERIRELIPVAACSLRSCIFEWSLQRMRSRCLTRSGPRIGTEGAEGLAIAGADAVSPCSWLKGVFIWHLEVRYMYKTCLYDLLTFSNHSTPSRPRRKLRTASRTSSGANYYVLRSEQS